MFNLQPVGLSHDLIRIKDLPQRDEFDYPSDLIEIMTDKYATAAGKAAGVRLFEVQARALWDVAFGGRGFFPMAVGSGKTLVSFLLPRVLNAKRPLLIIPAGLMRKTNRDWLEAMKHWQVARHIRFMSYEKLGRVTGAKDIEELAPDLIMCDEAQKLKNPRAAVTRRVARYIGAHKDVKFVPLSGTIMKGSLKDFAHLVAWSHRECSPLPLHAADLTEWCAALDEKMNPLSRRSPGALLDLMPAEPEDGDGVQAARKVFYRRLNSTMGVVSSAAKDGYGGALNIDAIEYSVNAATEANFQRLREEACRPDGWALSDAMQSWRVARELAVGLHYTWAPLPPEKWLDARKQWAVLVRDYLKTPQAERLQIDSEFQVLSGVLAGTIDDPYGVLDHWRGLRDTFTVNSIPVWHDTSALEVCAHWMQHHPKGIVWTEHRFFAARLAKMTGYPFFGPKGLDASGKNFIQDASGPIIASVAANAAGRNLQFKWCDNLITAAPCDSERLEQLIGRTHRIGQEADEVTVSILVACREHLEAIPRALASSAVKEDLLGAVQKIRLATVSWPDTHTIRHGFRWV